MVEDKWQLAHMLPQEIIDMCANRETAVLNQSVMVSLNMLSNGHDIDNVECRLQVILEIAEGLGIDLEIPIGRKMIFQRIGRRVRERLDGVL